MFMPGRKAAAVRHQKAQNRALGTGEPPPALLKLLQAAPAPKRVRPKAVRPAQRHLYTHGGL